MMRFWRATAELWLGVTCVVGISTTSKAEGWLDSVFGPDTFEECVAEAAKEAKSDAALKVLMADCRKRFPPQKKSNDTMLYLNCIFSERIKFEDVGVVEAVPYFKIDLQAGTAELIHGPKTLSGRPKIEATEETITFGTATWNRRSGDLFRKLDDGFKKVNSCYLE